LTVGAGALTNAKDTEGDTALHWALSEYAIGSIVPIIKALLKNGSDVNAQNMDSRTPLHDAVINWDKAVIEEVLAHGPDVNLKDNHRRTPLHYAVLPLRPSRAVVEAIVAHNPDVDILDETGSTALDILRPKVREDDELLLLLEHLSSAPGQVIGV
jgi:ankyrin repeat protein